MVVEDSCWCSFVCGSGAASTCSMTEGIGEGYRPDDSPRSVGLSRRSL